MPPLLLQSLRRVAPLFLALLLACGGGCSHAVPQGTIEHGPFEIVAGVRRVSTGTFPNQGGNPFASREVSVFQVRWRGQSVATPGGNQRFWHVLRLDGAPSPTLLLVTTGFVLATEEAGALKLRPLRAESSSLAELQWLDARAGQPGRSQVFGIQAVGDLDAGTRLSGGRWLRLGSRIVIDVPALAVHEVSPWVPHQPGVPITSLSRDGDEARAFSPRRTQYVLAASGYDTERQGAMAYGLLVVDIAVGSAYELRVDRRRFRFGDLADLDADWLAHHFSWDRDAAGRERLVPRSGVAPWPWRGRLHQTRPGQWQFDVPRIDAGFLAVVRRVAAGLPGFSVGADEAGGGFVATAGECRLRAQAFGRDGGPDDRRLAIWQETGVGAPAPSCELVIRRLAQAIDAELASGRHDGLLVLD